MFFTKILQEKGCPFFIKKKLQEKGYGFGDCVGTPAYKNQGSAAPRATDTLSIYLGWTSPSLRGQGGVHLGQVCATIHHLVKIVGPGQTAVCHHLPCFEVKVKGRGQGQGQMSKSKGNYCKM